METLPADFCNRLTLNAGGRLLDLSTPKLMGILNVTPDSFYDGGRLEEAAVLAHVSEMLAGGAAIVDVGGYSSRPGAKDISPQEEADRVLPVITKLKREFPDIVISVDTFRADIALRAVAAGAVIVNDISAGLLDPKMLATIAETRVPYIMMHMRGTPQTMASLTHYEDVVKEVMFFFSQRISAARELGINDLIVDPGFGFAKTVEQNYALLRHLDLFSTIGLPVLAGLSRKSMATRPLGIKPDQALNATTALNTIALMKGANILRVHDVKEAAEAVKVWQLTV